MSLLSLETRLLTGMVKFCGMRADANEMPADPRLGTSDERALARDMYEAWLAGMTKSDVEERFLGSSRAHGKRFSLLVKKHLGIDTERAHPLTVENERLRRVLRTHGIDPDTA